MNKQEIKKLEQQVLENLKKYIKDTDTIIAGVSGGPDSMFLLHFLKKLKATTIVAHLNHKLRKESDKEEKFVKELSKDLVYYAKTADINKLSKKAKKGMEETGRKIRYEFFNKLAAKYKAKFIITAHHADDNLETIILNFTRGAGLQGLSGMQELENKLLRPLLNISKKQILSYLKALKLPFKTDKSNTDTKFKRNFIRHKIIPQLEKINPSLTETISKNANELRKIHTYLKDQAEAWIKKTTNSPEKLDAKSFRQQHESLQKIILLQTHQKITGNTLNIENVHLKEVITMINNNVGNKKKKLGQLTIEIRNNIIYCKYSSIPKL